MPRRAPFPPQRDPKAPPRVCDAAGCTQQGEFRAPKDRALSDYHWFCLPHVRAYNAAWDFFRGVGPAAIEASLRADTAWQRPTWPLGRLGGGRFDTERFADPLGLLRQPPRPRAARRDAAPAELRAALGLLDLPWPLDPATLKSRYKELAKRFHPDANGGDRSAEERLKDINRAYSLLRRRVGGAEPAAQAAG